MTGFPQLLILSLTALALTLALYGCGSGTRQDSAGAPRTAGEMKAQSQESPVSQKKVIETANVTLETANLAVVEKQVMSLVEQNQGRMDTMNVSQDSNSQRRGSYTIRIPQGKLQQFIDSLTALPDVTVRQKSISGQDVSEEYIDINARLENMQRHETRLRELLARANSVEEILKVESELSRVRSQIESTTGRLKNLTGRIEMSTLNLSVREVNANYWSNYSHKLKNAFNEGIIMAGNVLLAIITGAIGLAPLFAFLAVLAWLWRKRKAFKLKKNNTVPPA